MPSLWDATWNRRVYVADDEVLNPNSNTLSATFASASKASISFSNYPIQFFKSERVIDDKSFIKQIPHFGIFPHFWNIL